MAKISDNYKMGQINCLFPGKYDFGNNSIVN